MHVYAKFMKDLLNGRHKLKYGENISLAKECSAIIHRKLPPKLIDPNTFTILCTISSLKIGQALCDLGARINLMPISMMKNLNFGEPEPTKMTLTLDDRSITYPYGVLEDVMVRVDGLLFPIDFVIFDMPEDVETPLLLRIPFLVTWITLIDVERGKLIIKFNK